MKNKTKSHAPSEDTDKLGHPSSLIRVFAISLQIPLVWNAVAHRPPDLKCVIKIYFLIPQPKDMLWVLKTNV